MGNSRKQKRAYFKVDLIDKDFKPEYFKSYYSTISKEESHNKYPEHFI